MRLDDRRAFFRKGLCPIYISYYDSLCTLLGREWQPYFGFRSIAEQNSLYAQGRSTPGKIVTFAKGGESAHNYGCATDWTVWDENAQPIWLQNNDPKLQELSEASDKVGAEWGGHFPIPDCPHVQLGLSLPWKDVKAINDSQGAVGVLSFIKDHAV